MEPERRHRSEDFSYSGSDTLDGLEDEVQFAKCSVCLSSLYLAIFVVGEILLFASIIAITWTAFSSLLARKTDHELLMEQNAYSPLFARTKFYLQDVSLKNSFFNEYNLPPTLLREDPSLAVDAAWSYVHNGGARNILLTEDEVRGLGKDPRTAVKAPEKWGKGPNQYLGVSQAMHDIHCLNNIRKFAYADHYYGGNITWQTETHFLHCLDTIRQSLMCKYSTDIYTVAFLEDQEFAVVDFRINRKCQDYEAFRKLELPVEKTYTDEQFYALRAGPDAILVSSENF